MKCYLCNSTSSTPIHDGTRDADHINVMRCTNCSLVYLSHTDHATADLYENNGQVESTSDIEIKDYNFDTERRLKDYASAFAGKSVLDYGCGRGSFATALKNSGLTDQIFTLEPNQTYRPYLEKNFSHVCHIEELPDESLDFIAMFHVLEHIADPIIELKKVEPKLKSGGKIIIEVPHSEDALLQLYQNSAFEDFTYWSLHLYLFNRKTLELIASRTPYKISCIQYHQRYGLANHLHWLAKGAPGGQSKWFFLNDKELDSLYGKKLAELGLTDTISMILVKK